MSPHSAPDDDTELTAFVLGGGGLRGAAEVGMIRALAEAGVAPDLVVGTSIGSVNGAIVASRPMDAAAQLLGRLWRDQMASADVFGEGWRDRVTNVAKHRTFVHSNEGLRDLLQDTLGDSRIEDLRVRFQCSAACIETSGEWWFENGSLVDALLASCAVPGLLPPVEVGGLHFIDGGIVNSIPVARAIELGATTVFVLQAGNVEAPLSVPRQPWDVAFVAFEIARRHRYVRDMALLPSRVTAHVLPTGTDPNAKFNDPAKLRYKDTASVERGIEAAYQQSVTYLNDHLPKEHP